jgi:hypothetical protein
MKKKKSFWIPWTVFFVAMTSVLLYTSQWPAFALGRWQNIEDSQSWLELRSDHTYTMRDPQQPERSGSWRLFWGTLSLSGSVPSRYHYQFISDRTLLDNLDTKGLTVTYKKVDGAPAVSPTVTSGH